MKRFLIALFILPLISLGQSSSWMNNPLEDRAFVKNKGQYNGRNWQPNNPVQFALSQQDGWFTFFTKTGITHRLEKLTRNPNKKNNPDAPSRVHISQLVDISFIGANTNVQIIPEETTTHYYSYAVKDVQTKEVTNINHVNGFKKLTYKNIYNNIDIEYTLHPKGGIKYNVILHPGADPSQIKMKYNTSHTNIQGEFSTIRLNTDEQLEISTSLGDIIEHKPITFYASTKNKIKSKYNFNNNELTFELDNYDHTKKVIIDPWVVTPNFNAGDFTREVETDGSGNVFVIGGEIPMELRKYDQNGVFQWTYVTPWDTNGGDWLGTLATDDLGVSYITQGTGSEIERVNTAGGMVWHATSSPGGLTASYEFWSITFNCDNTKLIIGGTQSTEIFPFPISFYASIFDIDINNGNVLSSAYVDTTTFGAAGLLTPIEVRSISSSKNAKYIFLTHEDVGSINQDFGACPNGGPDFQEYNTESLGYKCENYLSAAQNGGGLKALVANDNYFYTHKGDEILQWDVTNGNLLNTVSLPGGSSNNSGFGLVVHCNGLDVDAAGNVYAGSMDRVVKFDANLNLISSANTTGGFTVYDVSVNANGEVLAVGALLDNSTSTGRGGRIESLNLSATGQFAVVCCDANFCPVDPLCTTDPAVNLSPNTPGGTWSSSPATAGLNVATGVFDPAVAGPGTYTITYTLACGTNSTTIIVGSCTAMSVCVEANGDLTVTGGTGPYDWDEWTAASSTPITNQTECTSCGYTWQGFPLNQCLDGIIPVTTCNTPAGWTYFATGGTVTPPVGADTVQITDNMGTSLIIYDVSTLPPCSGCDATITQVGPFCENAASINLIGAQSGGTWTGTGITNAANGTFDPATAGPGSHVITYTLPGCNDTVTIVVNPMPNSGTNGAISLCTTDPSTDLFNQLGGTPDLGGSWSPALTSGTGVFDPAADPAGTYTYTVTNSCGSSSNDVVVTITASPTPGSNGNVSICSNATSINLFDSLGGTPSAGGTWSPVLTSGTGVFDPATDPAGTYTYTVLDCGGSPLTADVVVTITPLPNTGVDGAISLCPTDPATDLFNQLGGTPDPGGIWSPVLTSGTGVFDPSTDPAGTYTYTVTNSCGTSSNDVVVTITASPSPGTNGTASLCSNANTINLFDSLGGTPNSGGTWSPSLTSGTGVFDPATDPAGTYTYTVLDCGGSSLTADVVVNIIPAPNTGVDGAITLCPTDPATDLFTQLGGTPDPGGTWSPTMTSGTGVFDPVVDPAGTYTYTLTNSCGSSSNDVVVTITSNPSPGSNGTASLCSNANTINLFDSLGGTPSSGGTWSPSLTSGTGVFDPATDPAGTYTYTVLDCSGSPLTADVVVTLTPGPNAGTNGNISLCTTDPASNLFNQLGGTPDVGGTWSPVLTSGTGVFDPAVDPAGIYTYTVSNSCGSSNSTVIVTIISCTTPTSGYTVSDSTICEGDCIDFTDQSTGATSWQWTFNGGSPASSTNQNPTNICFSAAGTYTIEQIVSNNNGSDTTTSSIVVNTTPVVTASADVTIELGESTSLSATGTNGSYTWTPPTWLDCPTCVSPISTPDETITYTVIVVDSNGCSASDDVTVIVDFDYVIFVPNIFSPNGDGNNDILFVRGVGVESLNFFIYDRWGEKVFETKDLNVGWDGSFRGKKMNNAVFVYYLQATFLDGNEVSQKGDITLIR